MNQSQVDNETLIVLTLPIFFMASPSIDTRFLVPSVREQFNKYYKDIFEQAYKIVLTSVKNPNDLSYVPTLFAIPFLLIKEVPINSKQKIKLTYTGVVSVDPSDTEKRAIFISTYLGKCSFEEIAGCIAHEIAHFIFLKGCVDIDPALITAGVQEGYLGMRAKQESGEALCMNSFNEPVHQWLCDNDKKMKTGEIVKAIRNNADTLNFDDFMSFVLGDKCDEVLKKQIEKLGKRLKF